MDEKNTLYKIRTTMITDDDNNNNNNNIFL